eukprot:NODE_15175_length_1064_cov_4.929562.p1 GENE.NODE_15175_length_1064_cov_4.929562~~NODE_15175_length_1064_cov_4.929562.p1  ORF type:complete len:272 (+),score=59.00 NODE_15175_length_1064_cov_4.929562:90-905(+)
MPSPGAKPVEFFVARLHELEISVGALGARVGGFEEWRRTIDAWKESSLQGQDTTTRAKALQAKLCGLESKVVACEEVATAARVKMGTGHADMVASQQTLSWRQTSSPQSNAHDSSGCTWLNSTGPVSGIWQLEGTDLALAASFDTRFDQEGQRFEDRIFDVPLGYRWSSTEEWAVLARGCADQGKVFSGREGWDGDCGWNAKRPALFAFRDSARTGQWQHATNSIGELHSIDMAAVRRAYANDFAGLALVKSSSSGSWSFRSREGTGASRH